jgi:dTDP-4-dehydrorhamnose reductase
MLMIVGASGYIGKLLYELAGARFQVFGTNTSGAGGLIPLRLDCPHDFDYSIINPDDVVFLTAAISAPDVCAKEHHRSWAINVTGTSEFINKVMARGGRVIFFSSDTVYGHRSDSFDEGATANPVGEYAVMKHEVEKRFLDNALFKSIRLSYVFSKEDKFTQYLSRCNEMREEAEIFHPFYRAIIHRDDVIKGLLTLAQQWDSFTQNIFNFGGPELVSRIDFAEALTSFAFPNLQYRIKEPDDIFFKNRPRVIAMRSNVLPRLLGGSHLNLIEATQIEFAFK